MGVILKNNAVSTITTAISASDVGLAVATGTGSLFPTLGASDYFYATLVSTGGTYEVIKVTARVGDTMTIVRAQEGTTAQSFASGSRIEVRVTAASITDMVDEHDQASEISFTPTGTISATNVQAAIAEVSSDIAASSGSSLVGYTQGGSGSTTRTVQSRLRDIISIKDFGAVGDGTTDDTAEEVAGRAALKASGGGAYFYPSAVGYKINGRVRDPGLLIEEADFPAFAGLEPNMSLGVFTRNTGEGGVGKAGVYSFMVNGTGNMVPFSTVGGEDSVPLSGVVYSGEDAPHPVCVANIVSRYAGAPPGINWGIEVDMNNECPTAYSAGDARYGQGIVLNTGSTYSPDTAIVVQRAAGEGTGPGWKQGVAIKGVRDVALYIQAMTSATAPGMSPAATGTVTAMAVNVGGEAYNRFSLTESGQMFWGNGSAAQDVSLSYGGAGSLTVTGILNVTSVIGASQYWVGANSVVGARRTGWTAASGTATRSTFDTSTVTTAQLAERVKALLDDLISHGLIGA